MADAGAAHLSIGEVLGLLLEEFPDVTISKIRFLESQGLIEPERTPSGYRKFFQDDVELLRLILREQREKFLPLRVIKDRIDSGEIEPSEPTPPRGAPEPEGPTPGSRTRHPSSGRDRATRPAMSSPTTTRPTRPPAEPAPPPAAVTTAPSAPVAQDGAASAPSTPPAEPPPASAPVQSSGEGRLLPSVLVNTEELCAMAGVTPEELADLIEYGVVARRGGSGDLYGDDAVEIAAAASGFLRAGVDARHLRGFRTSAEREAGLYEQLILPALRQRNPQARAQAAARLHELDSMGARLREAMMRSALRRHLEA